MIRLAKLDIKVMAFSDDAGPDDISEWMRAFIAEQTGMRAGSFMVTGVDCQRLADGTWMVEATARLLAKSPGGV